MERIRALACERSTEKFITRQACRRRHVGPRTRRFLAVPRGNRMGSRERDDPNERRGNFPRAAGARAGLRPAQTAKNISVARIRGRRARSARRLRRRQARARARDCRARPPEEGRRLLPSVTCGSGIRSSLGDTVNEPPQHGAERALFREEVRGTPDRPVRRLGRRHGLARWRKARATGRFRRCARWFNDAANGAAKGGRLSRATRSLNRDWEEPRATATKTPPTRIW